MPTTKNSVILVVDCIHSFIFIILIVDKSLDLSYGFIFLGEDSSSLSKKCAKSECWVNGLPVEFHL